MPLSQVELLRAACCIAGLDRTIHPEEQRYLEHLAHRAGVGQVSLEAMLERARTDQNFYQEQFRYVQREPDRTLRVLFGIAIADRKLDMNERVILQHLADRLAVPAARFDALLAAAEQHLARSDFPDAPSN